ncbi:oxidoreductase [Mycobacterium kubicae]|uniref:Oxidoreductase n=2 Tax=Mycobacterium kubicae TaxID=120959 RepID=A0AAX1JC69_9MYCO|nr:SDR family oxidoreductase [Mycobacterium kubicae]QPI38110.1 SDR family oxidoreductase [Mycobacterium kubicae]GFG65541.1 oxidoreductase [Mycobacterium kubicae]
MLEHKKALIIGGANGIGRALVDLAQNQGAAHITVFDVDDQAGAALHGDSVRYHHVDVTDAEALANQLHQSWDEAAGFDAVANCAGFTIPRRIRDTSVVEFQAHLDLNLIPSLVLFRELGPRLQAQGHGSVVTVASVTAIRPLYGNVSYAAAKAGLIALTKVAALEYGPEVRCNVVAPGITLTRLTSFIDQTPQYRDPIVTALPAGRIGRADELAAAMAFLLSDHASYITGQLQIVDGGLTVSQPGMGPMAQATPDLLAEAYLGPQPT